MVHKEVCPHCKGNRYVGVPKTAQSKSGWVKCPACGGQGYKVRIR